MNSYVVILAVLFMIVSPFVFASAITFFIDISDGIILLSIIVFTMTFSIFIVTLRISEERMLCAHARRYMRHHRNFSEEDDDQEEGLTPSVASSMGPPKYEHLYPNKVVMVPPDANLTATDAMPQLIESSLYGNHTSQSYSPSVHLQVDSSDDQENDGLPSYSEAVLMEKVV